MARLRRKKGSGNTVKVAAKLNTPRTSVPLASCQLNEHGGAREGSGRKPKGSKKKPTSFKLQLQTTKDLRRLAIARKLSMASVIEQLVDDEVTSINEGTHGRTWGGRQTTAADFVIS